MDWKTLLRSFTGLALCWAAAEKLLREDSRLAKAARMVFSLLSLSLWLSGLRGLAQTTTLPQPMEIETLFTSQSVGKTQTAETAYAAHAEWLAQGALLQAECSGTVHITLDAQNKPEKAEIVLTSGDNDAAKQAISALLDIPAEAVVVE